MRIGHRGMVKRQLTEIQYRERRKKALELRMTGMTYEAIAKVLKIDDRNCRRDIIKAIKEIDREPSEEVLRLELMRLDVFLKAIYKKVEAGDLQAMDRAVKLMDRRAAYLGIDAPTKSVTADVTTATPAEARRLIAAAFGDIAPRAEPEEGADPAPEDVANDGAPEEEPPAA